MGLFDIDFYYKVSELSPPSKRGAKEIAWLTALATPIQWLRDKFLGDYRSGSPYSDWTAGTYAKGDLVVYKQIVYASLIDSNTSTPSEVSWAVYLPSFIGADSRVLYNGQYLVLTYALNQYYNTTYVQPLLLGYSFAPDADHAAYSDIYILNDSFTVVGFVVASTEPYCSEVGQTYSTAEVGYTYPFQTLNNFTIYVPAGVYALTNDSEIENIVNKIIPSGLNYTITSY